MRISPRRHREAEVNAPTVVGVPTVTDFKIMTSLCERSSLKKILNFTNNMDIVVGEIKSLFQ